MTKYIIRYKTKIKKTPEGEPYINYKKSVTRKDCDLRPQDHPMYNSDLMDKIIMRDHRKAINNQEWCAISKLPENISIRDNGFLVEVSIQAGGIHE